MTEETTFQRKLREKREAEAQEASQAVPPAPVARPEDSDLVPDEDAGYQRSDEELTIDRVIDGIDIIEAYRRWIPKPVPPFRSGKREGIHVSCPLPNHPDKHPSAWVNLDKKTWYCGGCDIGGDVIDLAAIHFGMGDYKSGKNFGEIRKRIAADYGYTFIPVPGRSEPILVAPEAPESTEPATEPVNTSEAPAPAEPAASPEPASAPVTPEPAAAPLASVSSITPPEEEEDDDYDLPGLDWRQIVTPGTFLDTYMQQTTQDDVPEEYHFWLGLTAIGMAIGRDVSLQDRRPVLGNLFLCILGRTGAGKSRATEHVNTLTQMAIPFTPSDPMSRGVRPMHTPSSGENMIFQFSQTIHDPGNPKIILGYQPIRGIVDYNELSGLIGRGSRQGSTLKTILMDFFDARKSISTASMTHGAIKAEDAFASVLTTTQPKALRGLIDQADVDSGFLNRWLFVTGTMKEREAFGGVPIDLMPCVNPLVAIHEWAEGGKKVMWSNPEAKAAYLRLFQMRLNPAELSDNPLLARVNLICKKLCLLLSANEMREEVTEEIVRKVEIIYDYLLAVWGVPERELGRTDTREVEERIIKLVREWEAKHPGGEGCPRAHITRRMVKGKYERGLIEKTLGLLEKLGELTMYVPPATGKRGRPSSPLYKVVGND